MAEFCTKSAERLGFKQEDMPVCGIFRTLKVDDWIVVDLCEGCGLSAFPERPKWGPPGRHLKGTMTSNGNTMRTQL